MKELMKAVAVTGKEEISIIKMNRPVPNPGQILVKIRACALCTYEQRVYRGTKKMSLPFVGGHEFTGVIAGIGSDIDAENYKLGTKVAVRIIYKCGKC